MRCCFKALAAGTLFASWALAATGSAPDFYARREYGGPRGCGPTYQAVADVNSDGIPDIVCSNGNILLGIGNGTFRTSPNLWSGDEFFQMADLNGDGIPDIMAMGTHTESAFAISFGNGDGTFQSPAVYPISDKETTGVTIGDFNGDGFSDGLTLGDSGAWLLTGKGGGAFNDPILAIPGIGANNSFVAFDMNGDGKLDLVVANNGIQSGGVSIYFGNGDGTFQAPVNYFGSYKGCNIAVADINSDGFPDVLCASEFSTEQIAIYYGEAGGKLRKPVFFTLPNNADVQVGDVNGDGIPDLVSDSAYVAYGLGHGKFSEPVYYPTGGDPTQVVLASLVKPGVIDLVTNATFVGLTVLLNTGHGGFIDGITTSFPSNLGCGTELDFNKDGIADLAYIQNNDSLIVMYGTGKTSAPFKAGPTTAFPAPPSGGGVCFTNAADLNGDGIPDFLVYEYSGSGPSGVLYPLFGTGGGNYTLGSPSATTGQSLFYIVDLNGDGKADLINPQLNQIQYGNGDGTFQAPIQMISGLANPISSVNWADLNGDGKPDLVVQVEEGFGTYVLLSNSSGGFTQTSLGQGIGGFNVAIGDLNGDGSPDLLLDTDLARFLNDGKGNFTRIENLSAPGLLNADDPVILDLNGDGLNDVAVADGNNIAVFTNEGSAQFSQPLYFGEFAGDIFYGNWHGQAANAGLDDIMMPSGTGTTSMLLNETK